MKFLLALVIALSVPLTAMSATWNFTGCEHHSAITAASSADADHASHMTGMQHDHHQHAVESANAGSGQCGHCSSGHCLGGSASLSVGASFSITRIESSQELSFPQASRTAAAHSLGLLRPPNLA